MESNEKKNRRPRITMTRPLPTDDSAHSADSTTNDNNPATGNGETHTENYQGRHYNNYRATGDYQQRPGG